MFKKILVGILVLVIASLALAYFVVGPETIAHLTFGYDKGEEYVYLITKIQFGKYPQSVKEDSIEIYENDKDKNGYYLGSDGERYAKLTAKTFEKGYKFNNEQEIIEGKEYYFKVEPITWRIIDSDGGDTLLVITNNVLEITRYDNSNNNYSNSEVKSFINNELYLKMFTGYKTKLMLSQSIKNNATTTGYEDNPYVCGATTSRIFLPSYEDLQHPIWFFLENSEYFVASDYVRAKGVQINVTEEFYGSTTYMLRSPSNVDARTVRTFTYNGEYGEVYIGKECGITPAFYIEYILDY